MIHLLYLIPSTFFFLYENMDSSRIYTVSFLHKWCYMTFPPVIHLYPCPCPHVLFWRWGISRLVTVLWVTRVPYLVYWGDVFPPFFSHKCHFSVKVNTATAELYMNSRTLQESFKPPPVCVLNMSVCSDQKMAVFVSVFCKIRTTDCCWLCTGSSTQCFYISNQQVG